MNSEEKKGFKFLQGCGDMGELIRAYDWSPHSLGHPGTWPQSLRTTLGILLHSAFPTLLFWGDDLICFYNDAFWINIGTQGRPPAIGKRGKEAWPEIWDFISPLIDNVLTTGKSLYLENQLLPFYHNKTIEPVYWTVSYSPAYNDDAEINGVIVSCTDTTKTIRKLQQLEESESLFRNLVEQAPVAISLTRGNDVVIEKINSPMLQILGNKRKEEVLGKKLIEVLPEVEDQPILEIVKKVLRTGEGFNGSEVPVGHIIDNRMQQRYFNLSYTPVFENGTVIGVLHVAADVTEQVIARKSAEESEQQVRSFVESAPYPIGVYLGKELRIALGNRALIEGLGKGPEIIGKPYKEALPDLHDQGTFEVLERVYATGIPYHTHNQRVDVEIKGVIEPHYFSFSFTPLFDKEGNVYGVINSGADVTDLNIARKRLEKSEGRLSGILQQAPVAVMILRSYDFIIELANPFQLALWERQAGEVIGRKLFDAFPEVEQQGFRQILTHILDTGEPFEIPGQPVTLHYNGNPKVRYFDLYYHALREPDGSVTGIVAITIEVTEARMARQAVEQSESKLRSVVDSAPFPIGVYTGKEMRIQFANRAILDTWGKGNNVIGRLYSEILPELENQEIFQQLEGVYTTGIPFHVKNQRVDLVIDGKLRPYYFNYSFTPLFDADGKVYGVMNTAADVTDLNMAHNKIEETGKSLRNLILKAPVAICIFRGPRYLVEIVNERMLESWNKTEAEVLNKTIYEALPEAMGQGFEELLDKVYTTGETVSAFGSPVTSTHNGVRQTRYVNLVYDALRDGDGSISGIMVVNIDVTEQVLARQHIEAVVNERTKELAEANNRLEQNNNELKQFAYIASHDLQEPIRKVSTFTQMLEKSLGPVNNRAQNYLTKIALSSQRMLALIRDVLTFSQLSNERERFSQVDLMEVLENIKSDFELLIEEKQATINCASLPVITAIPLQMNQLFSNLISNALKFSKSGVPPVIDISARTFSKKQLMEYPGLEASVEYYNIQFSDNGIGFDQENGNKIFEIFQRLHGRFEYEGTGIGLAICKKIALNHNGDLTATSSLNEGATFNIILPGHQSGVV